MSFTSLSTNCTCIEGTAGTEVASYLLRLLLHRLRLGLTPDSPKLRVILGTSASLESDRSREPTQFLSEFFGCDWTSSQIIAGDQAGTFRAIP